MKFTIPLLMAALLAMSAAQSQSATAQDVPSIAIPKTTAVLVIQTPSVLSRKYVHIVAGL